MNPSRRRLAVVLVCLAGCAYTQPKPVKKTFLLPMAEVAAATVRHPGTLKVGSFRVATPFEGKGLVYRTDELSYESDYYHEFFVYPEAMIAQRVTDWLQQLKPFEVILPPDSRIDAPYRLHSVVTELYGDVRDKNRPAAVLAIQFYLSRSDRGPERVIYNQDIRQRVSLADASPEALVRGLGTALERILAELSRQLQAWRPPRDPS